ncbi:MAG TPA: hypothetical protein VHF89_11140 [Solirubrobacteraceae bacterium]|nr:hypothetical protein [Solirubrobacteraceae bacterium]
MSFQSRRLRVQLPCRESESVVDLEVLRNEGGFTEPPCHWVYNTPAPCHSLTCLDLPCDVGFGTPCVDSPLPPACPAGFITPDVTPPPCPHGNISLPGCHGHSRPCFPDTREPCSWDTACTDRTHCIWTINIVLPDDPPGVLVDAHALPMLRAALEQRLRQIEAAELTKEHLQARLEEIGRAEQELRRRDEEQ